MVKESLINAAETDVALQGAAHTNTRYQNVVFVCCVLFGLALIANSQSPADGGWFWYAIYFNHGKHLYSDMRLPLQPLFILETAWFLALVGKGWLVSKIPALMHLVAYCIGLAILARQSKLSDRRKAVLLGSAFFISLSFAGYRFDDYHVVTDCFAVYSIVLLLKLPQANQVKTDFILFGGLGILSGLAITTRLNDGAALAFGVAIAIVCLTSSRKLISVALFGLTAALTVVLIVKLTGDSVPDYAKYSIFAAAGIKGGVTNVLGYPLQLPWNALGYLTSPWIAGLDLYCLGVAAAWVLALRSTTTTGRTQNLIRVLLLVLLTLLPLPYLYDGLTKFLLIFAFSAIGTPAACFLGGLVFLRLLHRQFVPLPEWNPRESLLLIPLSQLASASMSSAGQHTGIYQPLAVMMLLLPVASPIPVRREFTWSLLFALMTIAACSCAVSKARIPYSWHSYHLRPMFTARQWYSHPVYGPMIIETDQLKLFSRVCEPLRSGPPEELLSLPLSYANYFCSTPPWHGYVQTFFDTSSKETISGLMQQLQQSPPKWILYQRQLDNLRLHERIYNQGKPLPHRALDQMISQKIANGTWVVVYTNNYENFPAWSNEWILIRTRP